ncbi:serine hydrolase domain-containing protein [Reichenbachiella versicolor]|uniref:serine hydrolase domain-containing protein n=1 Tax=Reichenbachiella versicolor TaxID=1821036 RepID=UPI000D6E3DA5|nr:serine hydrolase domain-containing protein [Reichenbachiella versicolor]
MNNSFLALLLATSFVVYSCDNIKKKTDPEKEQQAINDYFDQIDSLILTTSPRKFNGVISITQNGKSVYSKAYGYSNLDSQTPISLNDNFRIQSNSKQITAVIILREAEKGNIELHSPISKYLPDFTTTWVDSVTVHQLVNMSAGIAALDEPLLFEPGTSFHYSNPAYGLLGRIIKNVSGKKYTELANSLFKEIGMNDTYCYQFDGENQKLINGYQWTGSDYNFVEFSELGFTEDTWNDFIPTGGIISNVKDLHTWDTKLHHGELLKPASYEIMTNSEVPDLFAALSDEEMSYGYGIDIAHQPFRYLGHGGSGFGFVSIKFIIPEQDMDVIVLENLYHTDIPTRYHFEKEIRKILINGDSTK